jgi:N-methylhydantoinase B
MSVMVINGSNRDGQPYGNFLLDSMAGGGGAYNDHDGLTASGDFCVPRPTITNVETHEANGPILFLYRSIVEDSGGAGRQRGGATVGLALTPHDTDELTAMMIGHGVEVPNSAGVFGGLEGSCNRNELLHGVDGTSPVGTVSSVDDHGAWPGRRELMNAKPGFLPLRRGDVLAYSFQGGGGYGDPIERTTAEVWADVEHGYVSAGQARALYGVVLGDDRMVDEGATAARRRAIRVERTGGGSPRTDATPVRGRTLTPSLTLAGDGVVHCGCGFGLGEGPDWKSGSLRRVADPLSHGRFLRLHAELEIREYICPACGTMLESNVSRIGDADLITSELM